MVAGRGRSAGADDYFQGNDGCTNLLNKDQHQRVFKTALDGYATGQDRVVRTHEINTKVITDGLKQYGEIQRAKYVQRWFGVLAMMLVAPMAFKWLMINLYDVFWCRDCMGGGVIGLVALQKSRK